VQFPPELVGMNADEYRRHVELVLHQQEIKRCLLELDVSGIRKVWGDAAPHLDQPDSDWEALRAMHMARVQMKNISPQAKRYSEHWLKELKGKTRIAASVGIVVGTLRRDDRERAEHVKAEMVEAVLLAHREGVDLDLEAPEVQRRMRVAHQKVNAKRA
jgi:hypothetical protein